MLLPMPGACKRSMARSSVGARCRSKFAYSPKDDEAAGHVHGRESQRVRKSTCAEDPFVVNNDERTENHPYEHPENSVNLKLGMLNSRVRGCQRLCFDIVLHFRHCIRLQK